MAEQHAKVEKRHQEKARACREAMLPRVESQVEREIIAQALADAEAEGDAVPGLERLRALVVEWRGAAKFAEAEQLRYAGIGAITELAHARIHEHLNTKHANQLETVIEEIDKCQK